MYRYCGYCGVLLVLWLKLTKINCNQTCNSLLLRVLLPSPQRKSGSRQTFLPSPQHKSGSRQTILPSPNISSAVGSTRPSPHEKRRFCADELSINLKIFWRFAPDTLILISFYILMLKRAPKNTIF